MFTTNKVEIRTYPTNDAGYHSEVEIDAYSIKQNILGDCEIIGQVEYLSEEFLTDERVIQCQNDAVTFYEKKSRCLLRTVNEDGSYEDTSCRGIM
jgi:adenosine/AMP kinase